MAIGFAERAVQREFAKIEANPGSIGALTNGWVNPSPKIGNFGTEYKLRAGISFVGFGANLPADGYCLLGV